MTDLLLYGPFQNTAGQGVVGLTGTVDIYRVLKSPPFTSTLILASGTFSEVGSGIYYIGITGANPKLYDYPAMFKTTGSVSSQWTPSIRWDAAESWATEYGYMDAPITSRMATGTAVSITALTLSDIVSGVWANATRTLTSYGTLIADIWSYVTRTLTSGGGGGGATAAEVWTYVSRTLTQTSQQIIQSLTDNTQINVYKSSTFNVLLQNLPDFTGWQKMWFTVKEDVNYEVSDSESIIQIQLTAPTGTASDGLLIINKEDANLTDGYLTVVSSTSLRMKVKAGVTGNLPPKTLYYGIKYLNSDGDVVPLSEGGEFVIHHSTSKKVT